MTKKLLVAIPAILLSGVALFAVGVLGGVMLANWRHSLQQAAPIQQGDHPEQHDPTYGLPLEITVEGVPEVPERIRGPSPPIEEDGEHGGADAT